ncbi:hypothetical protein [Wolbachia endosymbiont (group A) of Icerya purchasi]|uniref:hypothetical protein n=1 Tax=Wolbachia endosymbiont (group A) of Icerya purchasi TaxID=2954019 RepID=UPI00222E0DEB|nr:hypothetical protein [Wolbachia endosymbiont (group A) of Icerya purchasi]
MNVRIAVHPALPYIIGNYIINANSGLKENRKGRKQGKLSSYKKIDEVTHGRYNKTVLFGR